MIGAPDKPDEKWLDRKANRTRTHFGRHPSRVERAREEMLRDWFGPVEAEGEILAHRSGAEPVGNAVKGILSKLGLGQAVLLDDICEKWGEIVGADAAKVTRPVSVNALTVTVEVDYAPWMYELERTHKTRVEQRLGEMTGGQITTVRFIPAGRSDRRRFRPGAG